MAGRATWRRALLLFALAAGTAGRAGAQAPVTWSAQAPAGRVSAGAVLAVDVVARIEPGWHIYSIAQQAPPIATRLDLPPGQPFALFGAVGAPKPRVAYDAGFGMDTEFYDGAPAFALRVSAAPDAPRGRQVLRVRATCQACNDTICLPPRTVVLEVPVEVTEPVAGPASAGSPRRAAPVAAATRPTGAPRASAPLPAAPVPAGEPGATPSPGGASSPGTGTAAVAGRAQAPASPPAASAPVGGQSLLAFLWLAMSVGALSLLTPCVFPMVPITVSYFTNHAAGSRAKAVQQALVYMVGIVLTFTALGMALALLVGATSLNRFAASPWVNLALTAIFVGFALSLFGFADVRVPASLVTRLDALTRRPHGSRALATLLMGLTFTLTSFTCTAPFVGTLLVMAAGGDWQWPLVGMLAFSTVFALPFFVLALMPQWLARLPRSGGWLNSVKVMMAFLEVAAAMKFVSNVDLVWRWGIFTRDVVLATWVVIGVLMALYVIGLYRFRHDAPVPHVGLGRLLSALACGTIALWLMTGLFGKRLGEVEAFLPPPVEAAGQAGPARELPWMTNDYEGALARARREGRLVFIDFTGYTCTNCRWMEANMFTRADVQRELMAFVLARLYTDGEGEVYQRQQRLQQAMYRTVALPLYAVVDSEGRPVASFAGLTRDPERFIAFLRRSAGRAAAATTTTTIGPS